MKELPREITQVAMKFGIAEFELATVVVKDTLECVRSCCEASLECLDVEHIDLYCQHRVEILVPIEEIVSDSFFLRLTFELKSFDFNYNF